MQNSDLEITPKARRKIAYCYGKIKRMFKNVHYEYQECLQDFLIACFLKNKNSEEIGTLEALSQMYKSCKAMSRKASYVYDEGGIFDENGNRLDYTPSYFDDPLAKAERNELIEKIKSIVGGGRGFKYMLMQHFMGITPTEMGRLEGCGPRVISSAIENTKLKILRESKKW